ncbi:MAG: DNA double-strand break repair nuclease NurA [Promethearchaeota archaeon]|nr:MAG: DNA double-strand break repair nuclease NurA [Candidatus Lokiarchaeota archaeon]
MEEVEKSDQIHTQILPDFAQNLSLTLKKKYEAYNQIDSLKSSQSLDRIFSYVIPEFAKDIVDLEAKKVNLMQSFHQMKNYLELDSNLKKFFTADEILDNRLIYSVSKKKLTNFNVAAVDGSFVRKCYTNFEFSLFRAISVIYSFSFTGVDIEYYPEDSGIQNYQLSRILNNTTDQLATSQVSIDRAFMEITLVNDLITKYKKNINMVILDGSILTEPLNLLSNSPQNTDLMIKYSNLIKEYKKLYNLCDIRKIDLVGVVKDTRSSTFRKLLTRRVPQILSKMGGSSLTQIDYRKLMQYFSDLDLFHRFLEVGDRSCAFSISSSGNSWIPRQLEILNSELNTKNHFLNDYKFYACYMKPVPYDFPIRIEFHQNKNNLNPIYLQTKIQRICEHLYPLCSKFEDFAIPIPQIEAHMRAKLSINDLNMVIQLLNRHIGEELRNYSKKMIFSEPDTQNSSKFDEFLVKNNFLVPKRRERMPL